MLLSLRNSIVFDFTLFLPRICFSVFGLELSKNLSSKNCLGWRNHLIDASQSLHDCGTAHIQARVDPLSNTRGSVMYRHF